VRGAIDKNSLRILYSNAYCFVLPSSAEAFPMVLLEAMVSGTPPIGSTAGGILDIIIDGINGLLSNNFHEATEILRDILEGSVNTGSVSAKVQEHAKTMTIGSFVKFLNKFIVEVRHGDQIVRIVTFTPFLYPFHVDMVKVLSDKNGG
jgi:glycosyltransferase involved in cell wall biosynthesis